MMVRAKLTWPGSSMNDFSSMPVGLKKFFRPIRPLSSISLQPQRILRLICRKVANGFSEKN